VESDPGEGCTFWIELPDSVLINTISKSA